VTKARHSGFKTKTKAKTPNETRIVFVTDREIGIEKWYGRPISPTLKTGKRVKQSDCL